MEEQNSEKKTKMETLHETREVKIEAPNFEELVVKIRGSRNLVLHKFSAKARGLIRIKQEQGSVSKKGSKRKPKNFDELYEDATYKFASFSSPDLVPKKKGRKSKHESVVYGFPAAAIRNAMVSACKIVDFQMTRGKLGIFVVEDGYDDEGTALVRITKGMPHKLEKVVRIHGTIDVVVRPMWNPGWEAIVTIQYDADMFSRSDIVNLLARAGLQVGIGEGRPDSKTSCGCGWGTFVLGEASQ